MAGLRRDAVAKWLAHRRAWFQAGFLLLWLDPLMVRMHTLCGPVFHCYSCPLAAVACPIGVIANFSALHLFPFVAVGTLLLFGATVGTAVCGWMCPFGYLQDLAARVPLPKIRLPNWAGYTRYAVLVGLVILVPFLYGEASNWFFCRVCPAGALEGAIPNGIRSAYAGTGFLWPSTTKTIILAVTLVAMLFILRPWCTLLCPLGAIFGLCNHGSLLVLRFRANTCKGCGQCDKMCRYGVLPNRDVNNARCIRCLECTRCGALSVGTALGTDGAVAQGPAGVLEHTCSACEACGEGTKTPAPT